MNPKQNMEALARANEIRLRRVQFKRELKGEPQALARILEGGDVPDWMRSERIGRLLLSLPWMGPHRVGALLQDLRISVIRTVGNLTRREQLVLLQALRGKGRL